MDLVGTAGQAVQKPVKEGYSIPYDPDEVYGRGMFDKVDCNIDRSLKNVVEPFTERVKNGLGIKLELGSPSNNQADQQRLAPLNFPSVPRP